jgi:hypothetical protein
MFFQDVTPDTTGYLVAGYTAFFVLFAVYLFSLFIRWRNLSRDLSLLQAMQKNKKKSRAPGQTAPGTGRKAA